MKYTLPVILLFLNSALSAQDSVNQYGLRVIHSIEELEKTIAADSNKAFVRIKDIVPTILLDIKYATTQNIFYTKLYEQPYALTRISVARGLEAVQRELKGIGLGLKIYDAYRPYSITCRMWDLFPDSIYMGKPWKGSKHNRGIAIDLTLVDLQTGEELRMPTPYDALAYPSHPDFAGLPDSIIRNRQRLIEVMAKHGFTVDTVEWWHFNYARANSYELLDINPAKIDAMIRKWAKSPVKK